MNRLEDRAKTFAPYLIFGLLSLAVLGTLLLPGYILTFDMVFTPRMNFTFDLWGLKEHLWTATWTPFMLLIQLINTILPGWVIQKLLLFFILFLAGLGAYRLCPAKGAGAYFAGFLYMMNPFTYVRFLAGHWALLAAYALTPFAIQALLDLLEKGRGRDVIKVVLLVTLAGMMLIHTFFLLGLALVIILLVWVAKEWGKPLPMGRMGKKVVIAAGLFLLLNLYWLIPTLTAQGTVMEQIGEQDMLLFASKATSTFGVLFDVASLHGFWREGYIYAVDLWPLWWLPFIFILFLVLYGLTSALRDKGGWVAIALAALSLISFILAIGAGSEFTRPLFSWLWDHVPFFQGFRESQKFVALLALSYAYLGGIGLNSLLELGRRQIAKLRPVLAMGIVLLSLLSPIVYSYPMFNFYGQLGVVDYPPDWYEAKDYLNGDKSDFNVLFLPWHAYMDYRWLPNRDKRLANPAPQFFDEPVIAGDNIEAGPIRTQSANPISQYVDFLISKGDQVRNLGELLAPLNVKYIILAHEVDYERYGFLYSQEDLALIRQWPGLSLFQNQHPVSRAYAVDSVIYVKDWEEYVNRSQEENALEHLYLLGEGKNTIRDSGMKPLATQRKIPVRYQVEGTEKEWTIFTVPQWVNANHWEYNGQKELKNLGFIPAFESSRDGGEVVYTRFYRIYLPSYIVSVIALAVLLCLHFRLRTK